MMWNAHVTMLKLNSSVLWQAWTKQSKILEKIQNSKRSWQKIWCNNRRSTIIASHNLKFQVRRAETCYLSQRCQERKSHTLQDKCQKICIWGEDILWGGKGETPGKRSA